MVGVLAGGLTGSTALSDAPVTSDAVSLPPPAATEPEAELPTIGLEAALLDELEEQRFFRTVPVAASRSTTSPGSFVRPARGGVTGPFGERRRSHIHPGIDYDGDTGDPVVAAGSGTVAYAGSAPSGFSGYGQMVLIDHGQGIQTLYAHLSRIAVAVGRPIEAGQSVGAMGTTGAVTGSHLHFELRLGNRPVDPSGWIAR